MYISRTSLARLQQINQSLNLMYGQPMLLSQIMSQLGFSSSQIRKLKSSMLSEITRCIEGWLAAQGQPVVSCDRQVFEGYLLTLFQTYVGPPLAAQDAGSDQVILGNNEADFINRPIYTKEHRRFKTTEWVKHQAPNPRDELLEAIISP